MAININTAVVDFLYFVISRNQPLRIDNCDERPDYKDCDIS